MPDILGFQIIFVCLMTLFIWWLQALPLRLISCFCFFFSLWSLWVHAVSMTSGEDIGNDVDGKSESQLNLAKRIPALDERVQLRHLSASIGKGGCWVVWMAVLSGLGQIPKPTFPGGWEKTTVNILVYRTQSRKQAILEISVQKGQYRGFTYSGN